MGHWSGWIHAYRGIVYAGAVAWAFVAACPISIPMPGSRQDASGLFFLMWEGLKKWRIYENSLKMLHGTFF